MCSIYGALVGACTSANLNRIAETFARSRERGRDSWGLWSVEPREATCIDTSTTGAGEPELAPRAAPFALIGSRRAEPTTEWVRDKRPADVQPFRSAGGWVYCHNGTIANDRELIARLRGRARFTEPATPIDTAAIGVALDCVGWEEAIRTLAGSFAIVAAHVGEPGTLYFAGNYKPLFIQGDREGTLIQIASQRHFFPATANPLRDPEPIEIPPYSIGHVSHQGGLHHTTLYAPPSPRRRVLAVCSGGLDSAVAAWKHHTEGDEVSLLHIDYRCRAAARERAAVEALAERMRRPLVTLTTDFFADAAQSVLTDDDDRISSDRGGESAAEFGSEWVPARNLVLLSMAVAYAERHGYGVITLGTNLEESGGGFPDNEQEFINKVAQLVPYALRPYHRLELSQPCGTLMKHEIVRLGREIGAPVELTWSCYRGGQEHCGACGPCYMRQVAHVANDLVDPVFERDWEAIRTRIESARPSHTEEVDAHV